MAPEHDLGREEFSQTYAEQDRKLLGSFRRRPFAHQHVRESPENVPPRWEYPEHSFIGDSIRLKWSDGEEYEAGQKHHKLPNGVIATYGQINGLAGDFYGTDRPISDGSSYEDQCQRFRDAWDTLATDTLRQPAEAETIRSILNAEVELLQQDPLNGWKINENVKFEWATLLRPSGCPTYIGLADINWDHFGKDAHTVYAVGHSVAIQVAKSGDLEKAYTLNAFADHFLEDSFAAGHVRTPRRFLHGNIDIFYDLCAKAMHDEESAIGLKVENKLGDHWTMYGDGHLQGRVDTRRNFDICKAAIQASANEVYDVWSGSPAPGINDYAFWKLVPNIDAAMKGQELAPMFNSQGERRADISDRTTPVYTDDWTAVGTWFLVQTSGLWNHPITFDKSKQEPIEDVNRQRDSSIG